MKKKCSVGGCERVRAAHNLCHTHYYHLMKSERRKRRKMAPRGAGSVRKDGYKRISVKGHPNASKYGTLMEHRYVMSQILGRPLTQNEVVHHKNGNRLDNNPSNLELWTRDQPPGQRVTELVEWAHKIIKLYG